MLQGPGRIVPSYGAVQPKEGQYDNNDIDKYFVDPCTPYMASVQMRRKAVCLHLTQLIIASPCARISICQRLTAHAPHGSYVACRAGAGRWRLRLQLPHAVTVSI